MKNTSRNNGAKFAPLIEHHDPQPFDAVVIERREAAGEPEFAALETEVAA